MTSLVLEETGRLALREIAVPSGMGPADLRIAVHTVGICGSDVHYYTHGRIGSFVVTEPIVLGHEASGTVVEVGRQAKGFAVGDRVCMEPGIPAPGSAEARAGRYNIDPGVTFWATPPVHGCLTPEVVHPAGFTHLLPEGVSFAQGAMVEPFAIGMQATARAGIAPGDIALVIGAGPIGMMVAHAALAGGCASVVVTDVRAPKLGIIGAVPGIVTAAPDAVAGAVARLTGGRGADVVFEATGAAAVLARVADHARPGGTIVLVGMPVDPVPVDIVSLQIKELRIETVFRSAHQYPRALALMASGKVDLTPLITDTFPMRDAIAAFDRAAEGRPGDVKLQITLA